MRGLIIIITALACLNLHAQVVITNHGVTVDVESGLTLTVDGHIRGEASTIPAVFNIDGTLRSTGNIVNNSNTQPLQMTGNGICVLNGTANQVLSQNNAGSLEFEKLSVFKGGGEVIVGNGQVDIHNMLNMAGGNINLNGSQIVLHNGAQLVGENDTRRVYDAGNGYIAGYGNVNAPAGQNLFGLGAEVTSVANFGNTWVYRYHNPAVVGASQSILRRYRIVPTNNTTLNATIRFHYFDASELNGQNENTFTAWESSTGGSPWTNRGGNQNTFSDYVEVSAIDTLNSWWTLSDASNPLPFQFLDFQATGMADGTALLNWSVDFDSEVSFYEILRSTDLQTFESMGIEYPQQAPNYAAYTLVDQNPSEIVWYRIRAMKKNGEIVESDIRQLNFEDADMDEIRIWPVPVASGGVLHLDGIRTAGKVKLYAADGKLVLEADVNEGYTALNLPQLAAGVYVIMAGTDKGLVSRKIMVSR